MPRYGIFAYEMAYEGIPVYAWVGYYDPDAFDGIGEVVFTKDVAKAITFPDMGDALAFYRQTSKVQPIRYDGKPNRPLTAYTVEVKAIPEEVKTKES